MFDVTASSFSARVLKSSARADHFIPPKFNRFMPLSLKLLQRVLVAKVVTYWGILVCPKFRKSRQDGSLGILANRFGTRGAGGPNPLASIIPPITSNLQHNETAKDLLAEHQEVGPLYI
jgi:hypothetical protein